MNKTLAKKAGNNLVRHSDAAKPLVTITDVSGRVARSSSTRAQRSVKKAMTLIPVIATSDEPL